MDRKNLKKLQVTQQLHDHANHFEILCLHKADRLKHYGLHYAKYVGRIARAPTDEAILERTVVDAFLICLSAANALNQDLATVLEDDSDRKNSSTFFEFADAVGRFADACEKIDHLESFRSLALAANKDVSIWLLCTSKQNDMELHRLVSARREVLSKRQAYHGG